MTNRVRITSDGKGGRIEVDDLDASQAVSAIDVALRPRELPVVKLDLLSAALDITLDGVEVALDATSLALLERLGWTAPGTVTALVEDARAILAEIDTDGHTTDVDARVEECLAALVALAPESDS